MTIELLPVFLQYGALGILVAVLWFVAKSWRDIYVSMDSKSTDNAAFIQKLVGESTLERREQLTAWREMTTKSIEVQQEYLKTLAEYTEAFGILETVIGQQCNILHAEHQQILSEVKELEKRDL